MHSDNVLPSLVARVFDRPVDGESLTADATLTERAESALCTVLHYGGVDGEHHQAWVLDQVVRALTGPSYDEFVRRACDGEDGPDTYEWDTGIAP